jgi:C1A family cysteine protease
MKRNLVILFLLGIVTIASSQELFEGRFAPLNPDFVEYQSGNSNPGFIPPTHIVSFDNLPQKRAALSLPEQFDMRTTGLLSPVGNQGVAQTCWAFATMDAIQAVWARMGFDVPTMSKENLANCHGFIPLKCVGGN